MSYKDEEARRIAEINALPNWHMRQPCKYCGVQRGKGPTRVNGQNVVYCHGCYRHAYNAPKTETGEETRQVITRVGISSYTKARILERDNSTCLECGRRAPEVIMHVGHFISVADCVDYGFGEDDYNCDDNLYASCEECNLARGDRSFPAPNYIRVFLKHNRAKRAHEAKAKR